MKLITELVENVKTITEAREDGKKNVFIEGVFLQADITNRNGRCYPSEIMEKEVERYSNAFIKTNRALGELGHPDGPSINLDRVSHMITSLVKEGTNYIGRAKLMDTPMGNIAKGLIGDGVSLGVSSRGMGSLEEKNGVRYVKSDFHLATAADIVADPSAPDAFVNGIMEGVDWIWENDLLVAQKAKLQVEQAVRSRDLETRKLQIFESFINKLSKL
jgi:hypothetical protein